MVAKFLALQQEGHGFDSQVEFACSTLVCMGLLSYSSILQKSKCSQAYWRHYVCPFYYHARIPKKGIDEVR